MQQDIYQHSYEHPILFFDGVCNLCNGFIQFLIRIDRKRQFHFASLQSPIGQELLAQHQLSTGKLETVLMLHKGKLYTHSDVAIQIAILLRGFWQLLAIARFIPKSLRDPLYQFIANNRYRWFGKRESCMLPTPDVSARFLDSE